MADYRAVAQAIVEGRTTEAWTGACRLVASDNALHPLSAVQWQVSGDTSCVILDATLRNSPLLEFYAIRLAPTLSILEAAHSTGNLPYRATILINLGDGPAVRGLAFCSNNTTDILIPDPEFLLRDAYAPLRTAFANFPQEWRRRIPSVFWRGGTTGRPQRGQAWRDLPRIKLCQMAHMEPLLDAGISHIVQQPTEAAAEIRAAGFMRTRIPDHLLNLYRYHVDIDGNTNSWPGFFIKLLSGSPVLKVASPHGFRQWYYDRLVPNMHYVPVASDLSDLLEKAHWLMEDDARAEQIGRRGRELAVSMTVETEISHAALHIARSVA